MFPGLHVPALVPLPDERRCNLLQEGNIRGNIEHLSYRYGRLALYR